MADAASEATLNTSREQARATSTPATVPRWVLLVPVVAAVLLIIVVSQRGDSRLHMWVLDVGQGDAILLRTPHGHVALVDGGPGATPVLNGIGHHLPFWQHNIDLLVLTHPHEDHVMGLIDVIKRYHVGEVVETSFTGTFGVQGEWLRSTREAKVPVHYARRGDTISFEEEPDLTIEVLSPATPDARQELGNGDVNNTSVVIKVQYGQEGILLEGDAQAEAEGEMESDTPGELRSAVLKVGHHGSDTSSTLGFLAAVRPSVAVISVGTYLNQSLPKLTLHRTAASEFSRASAARESYEGTCRVCGAAFTGPKNKKYCSGRCHTRAFRQARRDGLGSNALLDAAQDFGEHNRTESSETST